jgi:hypothetical protein
MKSMTTTVLIIGLLCVALGLAIGSGCQDKIIEYKRDIDTVVKVKTVERPVFVKPEVKIKTILVPVQDTLLVSKLIPCDTQFIAQADSVITTTKDTLHVSFTHNPRNNSYFSILFRPRPDSIITKAVEIPVETIKTTTDLGWLVSAFTIGLAVGVLGATR